MPIDLLDTILVIGAGLSGSFVAIETGKKNKVLVIEQGSGIVPETSSSVNECYKLHTGLHYIGDKKSALKCLDESIGFARSLPAECIVGDQKLDSPWRRGRHFTMSNSLFSPIQAKEVALLLQKRYQESVLKDIKNKVFGEPENFIKFLEEKDYPYIAKKIPFRSPVDYSHQYIRVVLGIETAESQIDIDKLRIYLEEKIKANKNITIVPNTKVRYISHLSNRLGYAVTVQNQRGEKETYNVSAIANCAWQNIEKLDASMGLYVPEEDRLIRVKVCIRVTLPDALRDINTAIFSTGPYCSFTNLGNGDALLTSEVTTNVGSYKAGTTSLPPYLIELTQGKLIPSMGKGKLIAERIRRECAQYFENPADLISATIKKIMVGHVKMMHSPKEYTGTSLYDPRSSIHQRQDPGIEIRALGYVSVSGNKMSFTEGNGIAASEILRGHLKKQDAQNELLKSIRPDIILALKNLGRNYPTITDPLLNITFHKILLSEAARLHIVKNKKEYLDYIVSEVIKILQQRDIVMSSIRASFFHPNKKLNYAEPESKPTFFQAKL